MLVDINFPTAAARDLFLQLDEALMNHENPSIKIEQMRLAGTLYQADELLSLRGVLQSPVWHPEGDVWEHTMLVVDEAVKQRIGEPHQDRVLMWAALCHDLGKPLCTVFKEGRWRSTDHGPIGVAPARALLSRLTIEEDFIKEVCVLVNDHMAPHLYQQEKATIARIKQLLGRLAGVPLSLLVRLGAADSFGRTTWQAQSRQYPSGTWLLEQASRVDSLG